MNERAPGAHPAAPPQDSRAGHAWRLRLGDLQCSLTSTHECYARMLAAAYGTALLPEAGEPNPMPDLRIRIFDDTPSARLPSGDRLIVRRVPGAVLVESDPMTCEVRTGVRPREIAIAVHDPGLRGDWLAYHFWILFNRALLVLDRVILHAAALAYRTSVALFVGPKGAGKSTIAVALGRAGADLLAEDHLLAWRVDGGTMVSGCNGRMRVTAQTERHFLGGKLGPETIDAAGVPKKEFPAARFFATRPHEARRVDQLFFPHVGGRFAIRPLRRRDALLRLMDINGHMLRFHDTSDYADFLSRLGELFSPLPSYDLELSPCLDDLDRLVEFLDRAT
jgi:hypothetical protein